ncbi:stathmin domain-containing protein 1 [Nematolebias whitei]|uniref:stathmin domain-containing protein 1 n=1 Tax=Nematolebias whitei TaxID=451745 RepID=UPI00189C26B2|nr:stathmin domain-containing protein 1 [Nematolebias whitei]
MGCGSSSTAVHPLTKGNGDQDETGSKLGCRGDSAVSKGTTDSGVVMENGNVPMLPVAVPDKLPPLTSESVIDTAAPGLLQEDDLVQGRLKSSEILEELLSQGIIPVGQSRERGSGAAYSIMLDDNGGNMRRPPARLESLKAQKAESLHSREEFDEKMRLVEERRKLKEDERTRRLRTRSARVRGLAPISSLEEDIDASLTPVESLQSPPSLGVTPASPLQIPREDAEGGERVREAGGDGREETRRGRLNEGGDNEQGREDGGVEEKEEVTHVEELKAGEFLPNSKELESDSSFQHPQEEETLVSSINEP